jgi:hypothetical protein
VAGARSRHSRLSAGKMNVWRILPTSCMASWHGTRLSTRTAVPLYCTLSVVVLMSCTHGGCLLGSDTVECA